MSLMYTSKTSNLTTAGVLSVFVFKKKACEKEWSLNHKGVGFIKFLALYTSQAEE